MVGTRKQKYVNPRLKMPKHLQAARCKNKSERYLDQSGSVNFTCLCSEKMNMFFLFDSFLTAPQRKVTGVSTVISQYFFPFT